MIFMLKGPERSHVDGRVRELASLRDYEDLALISIFWSP